MVWLKVMKEDLQSRLLCLPQLKALVHYCLYENYLEVKTDTVEDVHFLCYQKLWDDLLVGTEKLGTVQWEKQWCNESQKVAVWKAWTEAVTLVLQGEIPLEGHAWEVMVPLLVLEMEWERTAWAQGMSELLD